MRRLLVITLVLLLPPTSGAQSIPCSTCGPMFKAIEVNSVIIREPSLVVFGHAGVSAQRAANWRTTAKRLGYQLVVLDSTPKTVYVANAAGEIQWGWSDGSWPGRGFLLVSQEQHVSDARAGEPGILQLFAMSTWQRTPMPVRVLLWLWPVIFAVLLVTGVGASRGSPRPIWIAVIVSGLVILGWTVLVGDQPASTTRSTAASMVRALTPFAVGVWIPVLTALVSLGLARTRARAATRIVIPAVAGFVGVACYPLVLLMVACMQGDCL